MSDFVATESMHCQPTRIVSRLDVHVVILAMSYRSDVSQIARTDTNYIEREPECFKEYVRASWDAVHGRFSMTYTVTRSRRCLDSVAFRCTRPCNLRTQRVCHSSYFNGNELWRWRPIWSVSGFYQGYHLMRERRRTNSLKYYFVVAVYLRVCLFPAAGLLAVYSRAKRSG